MSGDISYLLALDEGEREAAREQAVEVRRVRKGVKENLYDGYITFDEFLDEPCNRRMRVEEALRAVPGIGRAKAVRIIDECGISPHRRVGGLGCRQRAALLEAVDDPRGHTAKSVRENPAHPAHGTRTAYNLGCRCERCRAANIEYQRRARESQRMLDEMYDTADKYHEPWSAEEDAALAALYQDRTAGEVAHALHRTTPAVRARLHKLGINKNEGKRP